MRALPKTFVSITPVQNHASKLRKSHEHKNKMATLKKYPAFQVGSRSVLTIARLCLGLKPEKTCCLMVAGP